MTDEERELARSAKRVLEDPATPAVLEAMVASYRLTFEKSKLDESALREHCYLQISAAREFLRQLTILAAKGKLDDVRQTRGGDRSAA